MKMVQDRSGGLLPLAWRWRGAIGAIVIGGGVMAAANAESLGILGVDFSPGEKTALNTAAPPDGGAPSHGRATPARARPSSAAPSGSVLKASGRVLSVAGSDLTLDWAGAPPAKADDSAADGPPGNPEFASLRSPAGGAEIPAAGQAFSGPDPIGSAVGGSSGGLGGVGGGASQSPSAPTASEAGDALGAADDPLQAVAAASSAAGPVPEPSAWAALVLGLGLTGAMQRKTRRRRAA